MKELEKIMKAFANKKRLEILQFLLSQERCSLGDIRKHIHASYRGTSKHLRRLYECDLIDREITQGEAYYFLSKTMPEAGKHILKIVR